MRFTLLFLTFFILHVYTSSINAAHEELTLKSEIRPGYGLMYENWGVLMHSLNKYYLILGIELPTFNFTQHRPITYFSDFQQHCQEVAENPRVQDICLSIWPLYFYYRQQELTYQKQIISILTEDIPAMLPNYKPPDFSDLVDPFDHFDHKNHDPMQQFDHFPDMTEIADKQEIADKPVSASGELHHNHKFDFQPIHVETYTTRPSNTRPTDPYISYNTRIRNRLRQKNTQKPSNHTMGRNRVTQNPTARNPGPSRKTSKKQYLIQNKR